MAATKQTEPAPQRSRLLLLDGHSLANRAVFALPVENFSTTTGQPTNAVYGFTAMRSRLPNAAVTSADGRRISRNVGHVVAVRRSQRRAAAARDAVT